jgi:hypothetical protein
MWYHSTVHRLFQDDLASVSISRLRASGVVTGDTKSVDIVFGEGDDGLRRDVKVVHRHFPNGGEWSFFVCPVCGRPARVLKLHEKPMCRRCCLRQGIGYRVSSGTPVERDLARVARLKKLRELLDGGSVRLRAASWTALGRSQLRGGEGGSRASRVQRADQRDRPVRTFDRVGARTIYYTRGRTSLRVAGSP